MEEMKKENVELRNTIHHRQKVLSDPESLSDVKPRPTSLYNIAKKSINLSNNSIVSAFQKSSQLLEYVTWQK